MNYEKSLYIKLRNELRNHLNKEIIVVCIGTDRSTGDSLGPLVGSFLSDLNLKNIKIYGTIDDPIHAMNLDDRLNNIKNNHPESYVICIDACLGKMKSIGKIIIESEPIKPGKGMKKELQEYGDCSVKGVVNISGYKEYWVLQSTRLSLVIKMAREITHMIKMLDQYISRKLRAFQEV